MLTEELGVEKKEGGEAECEENAVTYNDADNSIMYSSKEH